MEQSLTPSERTMRARLAAHSQHAQGRTNTAPATRQSQIGRFEDQVDPERKLSPEERARRVEHARKAHMARLAMLSARARRARGRS